MAGIHHRFCQHGSEWGLNNYTGFELEQSGMYVAISHIQKIWPWLADWD